MIKTYRQKALIYYRLPSIFLSMKMQFLGLIVLICLGRYAGAQVDSLMHVLKAAKEDSDKVLLLYSIGEPYENSEPEVAKAYYRQALQLSQKIGWKTGEIKFASYYTAVLNMQGSFDSSLKINLEALAKAKKMNNDMAIIKTSLNVASSYNLLSKNDSTLYYYMQGLSKLEKIGDKHMLAIVYNNLAKIYLDIGQPEKGIGYGKSGVLIARQQKDLVQLAYGLVNLGVNYSEIKDYAQALACFNEALQISKLKGDKSVESTLYLNIADIDYQQGNYAACKNKFEQALAIAEELELYETAAISLKGLAMYYLQTNNYPAAIRFADSALAIARQNSIRGQSVKIYKLLSDIYYASQDFKKAREYDEKQDMLNDSINQDNLKEITQQYETQYETARKDLQIKEQQDALQQRRTLNYLLAGIALALLIIAGLIYVNFRHRQKLQQVKINELETEKQLTATEAVLKGEEQERTRLAKDLHDGLGGMLSGIKYSLNNMKENLIMTPDNAQTFERSLDMLDSSIREMRRVAHNMMPEILLKYGLDIALKEFCTEIDRSGVIHANYHSIDMNKASVGQTESVAIYRIVQELVNNTIKHGHAKNVLVQAHISLQEKLLAVTVEDDGKGFDTTLLKNAQGMGWMNIKNRLDFLQGRVDVHSSPDKGTSVLIEINI